MITEICRIAKSELVLNKGRASPAAVLAASMHANDTLFNSEGRLAKTPQHTNSCMWAYQKN